MGTYFRLTTIDDQRLPMRLPIGSMEFLVEDGEFELIPGNGFQGEGFIRWRLFGLWPDGRRDMVFSQQEPFGRLTTTSIQFPVDRAPLPAEYAAEQTAEELVLSSHTITDRRGSPAHIFGRDRTWRFVASSKRLNRSSAAA